jgi:hypothetical protein
MGRNQSIVVDISGHGFGHLGQVTPVIQELIVRHPAARIIVRSTHPETLVRDFIGLGVEVENPPPEATLVMRGPTDVDPAPALAGTVRRR